MAVYYGGRNGNLWVTRWPDTPGGVWWSAPQDLGFPTASAPSTASAGLELDYQGRDNLIHVLHATGRWFRFWTALASSLPGW
jgi:hypothetical protein